MMNNKIGIKYFKQQHRLNENIKEIIELPVKEKEKKKKKKQFHKFR